MDLFPRGMRKSFFGSSWSNPGCNRINNQRSQEQINLSITVWKKVLCLSRREMAPVCAAKGRVHDVQWQEGQMADWAALQRNS